MTKHYKLRKPTDRDLQNNPMIGGSKGTGIAQATPDDLEDAQGANTIEGDVANDTNAHGGISKRAARGPRREPHL